MPFEMDYMQGRYRVWIDENGPNVVTIGPVNEVEAGFLESECVTILSEIRRREYAPTFEWQERILAARLGVEVNWPATEDDDDPDLVY